jgi:hypothetical protein
VAIECDTSTPHDGNICLKFSNLAPRKVFSAWGFGQIREKTWPEFFQASPDVTIQDGGETPILKKDLARIFSSQPCRLIGCHGYLCKNNGIMVTVARLSGQIGKSMETFV